MNFSSDYKEDPFNENYQDTSEVKASSLCGKSRTAFIRKVYTILTIQLAFTVLMTGISMTSTSFFTFQVQNPVLMIICLVGTIGIQIYIFCCNGARTYPANMIILSIFTALQAYVISFIASATGNESGNSVVFLAAFLTLIVVASCTAYACFTKSDFTTSTGIIIMLSVVLFTLFIITLFTDSPILHNIFCGVGVLLFGIYLIIDTQMIMGGKTIELKVDEYALASILLYIDVIQIFLYILSLLKGND